MSKKFPFLSNDHRLKRGEILVAHNGDMVKIVGRRRVTLFDFVLEQITFRLYKTRPHYMAVII